MKPLSEQNHYETLEIGRGASPEDVERAYRMARATYSQGSLAGHSVFSDGDVDVVRERIEIAYQTLSRPDARAAYDEELLARAETPDQLPTGSDPVTLTTQVTPPVESIETLELEELDALDEGEFDGARLRRTRVRSGLELDAISGVTKVNPNYLRYIEEERFDALPAAVYVRGFVMGYASCVGLSPDRVAQSYMARFAQSEEGMKRKLFSRG